jgi:hypothetical protein
MKINLSFKSPDAIVYAIMDAGFTQRKNPDEYDDLYEQLSAWVRHGEYLDVEYDTETKQMLIVKPK